MNILFALATGIMFSLGVFQLLRRDMVKSAMGFYILFTAINLLFFAVGAFNGSAPAYAQNVGVEPVSDPLVQALILTAIVISFGTYAILLGLISTSARRYKTADLDQLDQLKG
ncbi:MAG: NADH-quinone oxidoreductase subunit K [Chloroflexota bacterium]|nr:NADH-quinone oxidoreductase subunit K [Chloroflexota bacterium]